MTKQTKWDYIQDNKINKIKKDADNLATGIVTEKLSINSNSHEVGVFNVRTGDVPPTADGTIDDYAIIICDPDDAFQGGLLITNATGVSGNSFKLSSTFNGDTNASFKLGLVANNNTETFIAEYLSGFYNGNLNIGKAGTTTTLLGNVQVSGSLQVSGMNVLTSSNPNWSTFSPTISATTGTITSASGVINYTTVGKLLFYDCSFNVMVNGTGGQILVISLPVLPVEVSTAEGTLTDNNSIHGYVFPDGNLYLHTPTGAYPDVASVGSGLISGFYRIA